LVYYENIAVFIRVSSFVKSPQDATAFKLRCGYQ
jgi:hypothetical protein